MAVGPKTRIRRAVGCERCANTGFLGRAALAELLVISDAIRERIVASASLDVLRSLARAQHTRTLREDGLAFSAARHNNRG